MSIDLERIIVYPQVSVYTKALPNVKELLEIIQETEQEGYLKEGDYFEPWRDWYGFGIMTDCPMVDPGEHMPPGIDNESNAKQKYFIETISEAFHAVTSDFIKEWNFELPNWHKSGLSINKYDPTPERNALAMMYHTDYAPYKAAEPGFKFGLTCTIYLNDEYDGGEISFLHVEKEDVIDYKPKAGDMVVFPSAEPFYHGVKAVTNGNKYLIRTFWQWDYEGSPEWLENEKKYGKEKWAEMWKEQFVSDVKTGKWHRYLVFPGEEYTERDGATPFFITKGNRINL